MKTVRVKPDIVVSGVTSLDEARYFAAMGVDWIGFHAEQHTPESLRMISDWIAGPQRYVELNTMDPEALFELVAKVDPDGICIPLDANVPDWFQKKVIRRTTTPDPAATDTMYIKLTEDITDLTHLASGSSMWVSVPGNEHMMIRRLLRLPVAGLVLCPLTDADGFPDFDAYDAVFELISEEM
jgi:hypothetical protein